MRITRRLRLCIILACGVCIIVFCAVWLRLSDWPGPNAQTSRLHAALCGRDLEAVKQALVVPGVHVNATDREGRSAVHLAVVSGRPRFLTEVLAAGGNPDVRNDRGYAPLHMAASLGNADMVQQLLQANAAPNIKSKTSRTALFYAQQEGEDSATVSALLTGGAKIDGPTPRLFRAAFEGDVLVLKRTITRASKSELAWESPDAWALMHWAAAGGHPEAVRVAAEAGVPVDPRGINRRGPLSVAVLFDHASVVPVLVKAGAPVDAAQGPLLSPPLHEAVFRGRVAVVKELLRAGADADSQDDIGKAPLHVAAAVGTGELCRLLLLAGASVDVRDKQGCTPLYLAVATRKRHVIPVLLAAGADIHARNREGQSPFEAAQLSDAKDLKDILTAGREDAVPGSR